MPLNSHIVRSMRILLIEDDKEVAAYLLKALREAGHVPDHATDGETGAGMASEGGYDVLVVDRMLPKKDGLSIVEEMRARGDRVARERLAYLENPQPHYLTYGPKNRREFMNLLRWNGGERA